MKLAPLLGMTEFEYLIAFFGTYVLGAIVTFWIFWFLTTNDEDWDDDGSREGFLTFVTLFWFIIWPLILLGLILALLFSPIWFPFVIQDWLRDRSKRKEEERKKIKAKVSEIDELTNAWKEEKKKIYIEEHAVRNDRRTRFENALKAEKDKKKMIAAQNEDLIESNNTLRERIEELEKELQVARGWTPIPWTGSDTDSVTWTASSDAYVTIAPHKPKGTCTINGKDVPGGIFKILDDGTAEIEIENDSPLKESACDEFVIKLWASVQINYICDESGSWITEKWKYTGYNNMADGCKVKYLFERVSSESDR